MHTLILSVNETSKELRSLIPIVMCLLIFDKKTHELVRVKVLMAAKVSKVYFWDKLKMKHSVPTNVLSYKKNGNYVDYVEIFVLNLF